MKKPIVIAEIGCNHKGDINIAKEMIKIAKEFCGADVIKLQKRNSKELLLEDEYNAPHPNKEHSYGGTYGEHREFLEFSLDQHKEIKKFCEDIDVVYSTSVWDVTSAKEIVSLNSSTIKIPSACNLNFELLEYVADNHKGEIHLSFGMTTKDEETKIVSFFENKKRNKDLVIYGCTSGYPVSFEDLSLLEIVRLKNTFGERVKSVGFSGHHLGIAADIAALALGVTHIERHFTLDRTWKGTDHAASLEPDGLRKLCRDIHNVSCALKYKGKDILDIENIQRTKLKRTK